MCAHIVQEHVLVSVHVKVVVIEAERVWRHSAHQHQLRSSDSEAAQDLVAASEGGSGAAALYEPCSSAVSPRGTRRTASGGEGRREGRGAGELAMGPALPRLSVACLDCAAWAACHCMTLFVVCRRKDE